MKNAVKALGTTVFMAVIVATLIACGSPRLTGIVTIDGDPHIGTTLTANISALGGSGIVTYQWLRDGATAIADTNEYTFLAVDFGSAITVTVIRSDNSGSVTSAPLTSYIYSVGAVGPGGGIIFYYDPEGFTMSDTGETAHHLEAAPVGFNELTWASRSFMPSDFGGTGNWRSIEGTSTAIATGRKNTALILAVDANAPAALACRNYSNNGFFDWFLPSKDELNALYQSRAIVGNLGTFVFWSSSQGNSNRVWDQYFFNGNPNDDEKFSIFSVRPIRAF